VSDSIDSSHFSFYFSLAFYTVVTVLFDTFVVRIFLVPALFSLAPEWNWWPGSLWTTPTSALPQMHTQTDEMDSLVSETDDL
jgi:uncharacterized membrane protein YdfJ with MMPL/SSD domain